jgi:hypothetical protein
MGGPQKAGGDQHEDHARVRIGQNAAAAEAERRGPFDFAGGPPEDRSWARGRLPVGEASDSHPSVDTIRGLD